MAGKREGLKVGRYTIEITHRDKVFYPDDGITKGDIVDYYVRIADTMLPYMKDRPVIMHRFIEGITGEAFYQREAGGYFPEWIKRAPMPKEGGVTNYIVCNNAASLVYIAGQDCITPHLWLSRRDKPDNPDTLIFDLDPSGGDFEAARQAAFLLRELLDSLGLAVYLKTTGSRGLHVVVPLDRSRDFDFVRTFAQDTGRLVASRRPDNLTVEQRIEKRRGRVYIDSMRNNYGQTAVAPYAVRARPGAPVATPLGWEELEDKKITSTSWDIKTIFKRLETSGDPWKDIYRHARSITPARKRLDELLRAEKSR